MRDRVVLTMHEAGVLADAQRHGELVAAAVARDPVSADMALLRPMAEAKL